MAFETILEFDKNNLYKVKLEIGNIDTSTVNDVKIDEGIAYLSQEDSQTFSFCTREFYKYEDEYEYGHWVDTFSSNYNYDGGYFATDGIVDLDCEYYIDRFWDIKLENGELVLINTKDYEEIIFTKENFPEDIEVDDVKDDFEADAKYDVLITYEKLVEKDEVANLFTDKDKDELEQLKVQIKDNYSVTSLPVEIDWELCKGYARERGVSDEYLTEANLNRALELALEDIASEYTEVGHCFVYVKDNLIHVGIKTTDYEGTAEEDIETISKLTLEKDDLGILRLYVSGEMQDRLRKAISYKEVIERVSDYIAWLEQEKVKADTYIQEIKAKIKNILPSVMERFLNVAEVDKNSSWLSKKLELAKELEQAVATYKSAKGEMRGAIEYISLRRFNVDTKAIYTFKIDFKEDILRAEKLTSTLGDLQVSKTSFSELHGAERQFEDILKTVRNHHEDSLRKLHSKLEELLAEHSDNEKIVQKIEEILTITKQQKLTTAEEQMVSAWNKYIGLKMEGKE